MIEALVILACGLLDRLRGNSWGQALPFAFFNGLVLSIYALGFDNPWSLLGAFLFMAGSAPGWGAPLGAALQGRVMNQAHLEWWQVGPLKKRPFLALAARGFMWAGPTMAVAMPLSALIAKHLPWRDTTAQWEGSEFIRGCLNAALLWAVVVALGL